MLRFDETFSGKLNVAGKPIFRTECRVVELEGQLQSQLQRAADYSDLVKKLEARIKRWRQTSRTRIT